MFRNINLTFIAAIIILFNVTNTEILAETTKISLECDELKTDQNTIEKETLIRNKSDKPVKSIEKQLIYSPRLTNKVNIVIKSPGQVELTIKNKSKDDLRFHIFLLDIDVIIPKYSKEVVIVDFSDHSTENINFQLIQSGGHKKHGTFILKEPTKKPIKEESSPYSELEYEGDGQQEINQERNVHKKPFATEKLKQDRPPEMRPSWGCH
jgi:hypothetical protein